VAKAKSKKRKPYLSHGSEGLVEYGQRVVDDPMEPTARLAVTVNVRESSIDHMASRGRINSSQEEAGQRFRKLWELAAVGRSKGIDPAKEYVDGGGVGDPISDKLVKATRELNRMLSIVGPIGAQLLIAIIGEGKRIEDVASKWSKAGGLLMGRRAEGYVTGRMVEALDEIVRFFKLEASPLSQNEPQTYRRNGVLIPVKDDIRSSSEGHIGPVIELSTGKFGDIVETVKRGVDRGPMMPHIAGNR
jgi:hypothetical protein